MAEPETTPPVADAGGPADSQMAFMAGLERTIQTAFHAGERVFVFRLRGVVKGLQRWTDNATIANETVEGAVQELVLKSSPDLALWRTTGGDLLGFAVEPKPSPVAERIGGILMSALANPLGPPGQQFILSPRLGVCVFDPVRGGPDQAIEAATRTLAQTNFETPFLVHNRYIAERTSRLDQTAEQLPSALANRLITVEFQPRVDLADHRPVGLEALARWYHPQRGSIPPREFLRVAEEHGLLFELGRLVRAEAIGVARTWQRDRLLDDCRLWLNLAPLELCHPELIPSVIELTETLPYLSLGFEIADTRLLEDLVFLRIFDRLQELGVQLALDAVNHDTLSLGRIRRLPLSMLNLDGELVRSLPTVAKNRELVRLICTNAAERGTAVTACGVETTEQLEVAGICGVDLAQGHAISAVRSIEEMSDYLAADKAQPRNGLN